MPAGATKAAANKATPKTWKALHRGAPFTQNKSITMDEMTKGAEALAGQTILVTGTISNVCRKKGCWMVLGGENETARARVTFKGYSFFVPLDSAGAKCTVEGVVELKVMSEAERKHLADDAGKDVKEIPKHELRLIASGVALAR
jgi:NAD-dependent DNA ligase